MQRTIFIWDIHGCFDEFIALLEKIKYNIETDQLYLTGDLINKWPKVIELLNFLIKNPQIKSVIWNNEVNFIRYIGDLKVKRNFKNNKKLKNLIKKGLFDKKYEKQNKLFDKYLENFSKEHIEYLLNLPLYIENKDWILLHWGIIPWKKLEEHHIDEITRIRDYNWKPWYEYYNWKKTIIYGHRAANWLSIKNNTIWLDSSCVYWKHLTTYILNNNWWPELSQISAKTTYCPII